MNDIGRAARDATDHPVVEGAARAGYAANALVHLLIAWLCLQLALGAATKGADQSGALSVLSQSGLGKLTLWACVIGFAGLGLWQLADGFVPWREVGDRVKAFGKGIAYLFLAFTASQFARGSETSSTSGSTRTRTVLSGLLDNTGGRILVVLIGLGVIAIGGYHVYKGVKEKFLEDLEKHPGRWAVLAGRIGYALKGVALAVVGILFVQAAWTTNAAKATGLDGALHEILRQPFGRILVDFVGLGFAAFAVYSAARSRYGRV